MDADRHARWLGRGAAIMTAPSLRPTFLEAAYDAQFDRPLPVIDLRGKPCGDPWCRGAGWPHMHPGYGRTVPLCWACEHPFPPDDLADLDGLPHCGPCLDRETGDDGGPDRVAER